MTLTKDCLLKNWPERGAKLSISRRDFIKSAGASALLLTAAHAVEWSQAQTVKEAKSDVAIHLANRLTWGARPEDIAKIKDMGAAAYIDWQLEPEKIDDSKVEEYLTKERIFAMSEREAHNEVREAGYSETANKFYWGRIYRAINSERQLFEKVVEFWTDHFNVAINGLLPERIVYDREAIREHALGNFYDLLFATAKSSAMLLYLDNSKSKKEHPNENYAREVMELHTLGVDGGYSEEDIANVAKAFTGWTLRDSWPGRFFFDQEVHDVSEKVVLGQRLAAGRGIEDGLQVLDLLASRRETAKYVCKKLCQRFVSDEPDSDLQESATELFVKTNGDIKEVLRHILNSKQFLASAGKKFRRPLELVIAAQRITKPAFAVKDPRFVFNYLRPMGQLPFNWATPDGYPDTAESWISTNGMLQRWNLAMVFTRAQGGRMEAIDLAYQKLLPFKEETVGELIDRASIRILGGTLEDSDKEQVVYFLSDYGDEQQLVDKTFWAERIAMLTSLLVASPYFQWS